MADLERGAGSDPLRPSSVGLAFRGGSGALDSSTEWALFLAGSGLTALFLAGSGLTALIVLVRELFLR